MSIFLTRLALEILLAAANIDTPIDAGVIVSVTSIQLIKYGAVKTKMDGFKFDSGLEADTYLDLKRLHDSGLIANLSLQQPFKLYSRSGQVVCKYVADFVCELPNGEIVVVESKGVPTPVWQLKKKLFLADYPHKLIEVRGYHHFPIELCFSGVFGHPTKESVSQPLAVNHRI